MAEAHTKWSSEPRLQAVGVTVGRGRRVLLEGLDLQVQAGEVVHVAGENGCGKSSLLRVLAGDVEPRAGHVDRVGRWAYVPERMALPDALPARRWLAMLEAGDAEMPAELDRRCGALSKGQLQRVALIGALHRPADLIILDEPWSGLDAPVRAWLEGKLSAAATGGAAVVFTDHSGASALTASVRLTIGDGPPRRELILVPEPRPQLGAKVTLVRGQERREDRIDVAERDRFLAREIAAGWGIERVEPCS